MDASSRICPRCGSENTYLWLGGVVAGKTRAWYHCQECGYFGPMMAQVAVAHAEERGF